MLRELEKAAAAFAPVDDVALRQWPVIATGNWGCGAFAPGMAERVERDARGFHMGWMGDFTLGFFLIDVLFGP